MTTQYNIKQVKVPPHNFVNNLDGKLVNKFERPRHYISYSEKDSNFLEGLFELLSEDLKFMSLTKIIDEESFKRIIEILEEESHLKGSKVTFNQVEESFKSIFPNLKQNVHQKILKFWKDERKRRKRSYMRKYWKRNLLNDKYLEMSFNENETDKSFLRKKRFISQPIEIYEKLKEVKLEFEEFILPMLKMIKEKEHKNIEVFKIDNENFSHVHKILIERYKNTQIETKSISNKINQDQLEYLETAQSIEDVESSKCQKPLKLKKHKEQRKNAINDNKDKESISGSKSISISSKYIKDIVSKKMFGTKQDGSPVRKKYKFKKENELQINNKKKDIEQQKIFNNINIDEDQNLTIIIEKSLVADYLPNKNGEIVDIEKKTLIDFTLLQKKLSEKDFFHQTDKYSSVFIGKKYRAQLPSEIEDIIKVQNIILKEYRRTIINMI